VPLGEVATEPTIRKKSERKQAPSRGLPFLGHVLILVLDKTLPPHPGRKIMAKATASEKREYKTAESAAQQKKQWEKKGYQVTRRGNVLYLKKG